MHFCDQSDKLQANMHALAWWLIPGSLLKQKLCNIFSGAKLMLAD